MKPEDFNFKYDPEADRFYTEVKHRVGTFKCSVWIEAHEPNRLVVRFEPRPTEFVAELGLEEVNYAELASQWAANIVDLVEHGRV